MTQDHTKGEVTLEDVLRQAARLELEHHHGALPVKVIKYTPPNKVDVQPLVRVVIGGELRSLPILRDIPVEWPATATHSITMPLTIGDTGKVIPAGGDIGPWIAAGTEQASDAEHRRFDLSDCVFQPGLRSTVNALAAAAFDAAWAVLGGQWKVGTSAATKSVGLNGDTVDKLNGPPDSMATWMAQVEVAINALAPGSITPLSTTFTTVGTITATAANLKAD